MKSLFGLIGILISISCTEAQNLVPNPSFESYSSTFCGIMSSSSQFSSTLNAWESPTSTTPDVYFTTINNTCFNYQMFSQYNGQIGIKGNQLPRTGDVMTAIGCYTINGLNQREYMRVQLSAPLIVGQQYVVEFYASLADSVEFATSKLGAHLSTTPPSGNIVGQYSPQLTSNSFISSVTDWVLIRDTITALDAWEYITIGNFNDDNNTPTQANPSASFAPGTYGSYYFIDDVRVEQVSVISAADKVEPMAASIQVFPNPSTGRFSFAQTALMGEIRWQIYQLNGQLVKEILTEDQQGVLNLEELNNGSYLLRAISNTKDLNQLIRIQK